MSENSWPTQQFDLKIADEIIARYREDKGGPIGFLEVVVDRESEKLIEVRIPEWIQELVKYYRHHYGFEEGQEIASKVITRLMLRNETVH